jgi:hypothetical protein
MNVSKEQTINLAQALKNSGCCALASTVLQSVTGCGKRKSYIKQIEALEKGKGTKSALVFLCVSKLQGQRSVTCSFREMLHRAAVH